MISTPELTIAELEDYMDENGRVHITVTVDQDFLASWQEADDMEWEQRDPTGMREVVEDLVEAIFVDGDYPETAYELLEPVEAGVTSYEVECDFSFELA